MLFKHIIGIAIIIDTTGTTTITDTIGATIIIVIGTGGIITGISIEVALPRMQICAAEDRLLAARLYRVESECG